MDAAARALAVGLGERLRRRREDLGLTQAQVAEAVGLEPDTVGRLERGERLPSMTTLLRLSSTVRLSLAALLADDAAWAAATGATARSRRLIDLAHEIPDRHEEAARLMLEALVRGK